jgi:hypothetical protein
MLTDIRLDEGQLTWLRNLAAAHGTWLRPRYRGEFAPADGPVCVAVKGEPAQFARVMTDWLRRDMPLADAIIARIVESGPDERGFYTWYFPGVLAPEVQA